jgi:uncharacterized protein YbjT (DUF2867 family)
MNITITGSLGNIGRRLTERLLANNHAVTVVSHSAARKHEIEQLGAAAAIGSIEEPGFLQNAFHGADAVFTMIPPNDAAADIRAYMRAVGNNYAEAIRSAGVRYVVNLSSIGADLPNGPGPTGANHYVEQVLNQLPHTHVLHLRPGMFYTNFFGAIDMMRHQNIVGHNFGAAVPIVLSHPHDIADIAAEALGLQSFAGKSVCYVAGDEQNGAAIAQQLGAAIGNPGLAWVQFPDEAMLQAMIQNGLSEQMATVYVLEIGKALREGVLFHDYRKNIHPVKGQTRLADFAREFAWVYNGQGKKTTAGV